MFDKVLKIALIVLLAAILIEVSLILFKPYLNPVATPSNDPALQGKKTLVNRRIFGYLDSFNENVLSSANVTAVYVGQISQILSKPGTKDTRKYQEALVLKPEQGPTVKNYLLIRSTDIPKLKVYEMKNGYKVPASFSELSVGDSVKIDEVINLLAEPLDNRTSIEIVKL